MRELTARRLFSSLHRITSVAGSCWRADLAQAAAGLLSDTEQVWALWP